MEKIKRLNEFSKKFITIAVILICVPALISAQPAEIPFYQTPYYFNSGIHDGNADLTEEAYLAYSTVVQVEDAPWLRLIFSDANLGNSSYLVLTSQQDGSSQRFNATTFQQWQFSSAYFNGNAVKVELYVSPEDESIFIILDEIMVGENGLNQIESQCGPTDDRIASTDPRAGRIVPIGCTGWIVTNRIQITAGHCSGSTAQVLEFNVPLSQPTGTIVHPGPDDQYAIDASSKVYVDGGIGNDWGVFAVFDNPNTGLQPIAAQGDAYTLAQDLGPDSIRITGYGVDTGTANQTNQTHVGPEWGSSGTTMRYQTDTEGGNSGSPVIDELTGNAVGVHTHGGCTTSGGNNNGTSTFNTAFWAAIPIIPTDPTDPNPPENFLAYSDYTTPTLMALTWTDPTTLFNGTPIASSEFTIEVERDGALVTSVAGGTGQYTDMGLIDGQLYDYEIYAKLIANDSTSTTETASWTAGGSPVPSAPAAFSVTNAGGGDLNANWTNPLTQTDGTPLDDFAGVNLYENGTLLTTFSRTVGDTGVADTEVFTPTTTNAEYWVTAFDNETPINESAASNSAYPPIGVPYLEDFETAVVGTPGTLPLLWTNETDDDHDWYVDAGGTPSSSTGPTVDHTLGTAAGIYMFIESSSPYFGGLASHLTTPTLDISSLPSPGLSFWYHMYGSTMGELHVDVYHNGTWNLDVMTALVGPQQAAQTDPWLQSIVDLSAYTTTPIQVRFRGITGSNFYSDMAIDDVYFTSLSGNPTMVVAPQVIGDTLLVGATALHQFGVTNAQASPTTLNFTITEDPAVSWLSVAPASGAVTSTNTTTIDVSIDATGLTAGSYTTDLIVAGDDTANTEDTVVVTLEVNQAPVVGATPDSIHFSMNSNTIDSTTLTITNSGGGPLNFNISFAQSKSSDLQAKVDENSLSQELLAAIARRSSVTSINNSGNETDPIENKTNLMPDYIEGEEIFGSTASPWSGSLRDRGNIFYVTTSTTLLEHKFFLGITTSTQLNFFVYQGTAATGTFTKISDVYYSSSGTGTDFYTSGPISVPLESGYYYYIGASWEGTADYFRGTEITPLPTSFGTLETGVPGNIAGGYPPGATATTTYTGFSPYYCAITTGSGWISTNPTSGTVAAGGTADVQVIANTDQMLGNDYLANIIIESNDPVDPEFRVPVSLHVVGVADIGVSPSPMDWGTIFTNVNDTMSLGITNTGTDTLHVTSITNTTSEFTIAGNTAFYLLVGATYDLPVIFNSATPGTYNDSLVIVNNSVNNPSLSVGLDGITQDPPIVGVLPLALSDSLLSGQTSVHYFDVFNDGASPLYFDISIDDNSKRNATVKVLRNNTSIYNGISSASLVADENPNEEKPRPFSNSSEAIWDLQFSYDVDTPSGLTGIAGAETDGSFLYGTKWSGTGEIVKFDLAGTYIETFTIPGVVNLRDLAYDGQYFYGSDAGSYIYQMDFDSRVLVSTITTPASVRAIAYDSNLDGFWYNNFSTDLHFVDRSGTLLSTITAPPSMYGCAYDNLSAGGPYLWIFTGTSAGLGCQVEQYDLATQTLTGVTHSVSGDLGDYIAGGLFLQPNLVAGTYTLGGLAQGTPDLIFGYELGAAGADWISTNPVADTVAVGDTVQVAVMFNATGLIDGWYQADVNVNSNDPVTPTVTVDASLHVTGVANIAVDPTSLDFGFLFLGVADTMIFAVQNPGTADLNVTGMATSTGDFTVLTATPFTVTPGSSQDVEVVYSATTSGVHADSVVVTHDAPIVMSDVVQLTGETANPPVIALSDTLLQHQMNEGEEDSTTLMIHNIGASTLDYELMLGATPFSDASSYAGQPVDPNAGYNNKSEMSPVLDRGLTAGIPGEAIWDIQFNFDLTAASGAAGNAGAEFDGTYFYSTRWASNLIHQYDMAGNLVREFSIGGVTGLRDLAYDGTYFYGGASGNTIYVMDFVNDILIGTINSPSVTVRNIAYDAGMDAFWVANWATDITLVDLSGTVVSSIPAATHGLLGMYGSAYDDISAGGPYLWVFDQGAGAGLSQFIHQIDLNTLTMTGVSHDVTADFPDVNALAGGLFITTDFVSGKATIGALQQGVPDLMICYELAEAASWVTLDHTMGSVAPGDSGLVWVYWHGVITEQIHDGYLGVYSNDPVTPVENVHLILDVMTGIDDLTEALPTKYALHQNYPNPFNPSTTIKYDLKAKTDVKLTIYNVLGQKVTTLVNTNQAAGFKNVVWNGLNELGEQVSTGVYIYRIEADGFVKSRKMVFMK